MESAMEDNALLDSEFRVWGSGFTAGVFWLIRLVSGRVTVGCWVWVVDLRFTGQFWDVTKRITRRSPESNLRPSPKKSRAQNL